MFAVLDEYEGATAELSLTAERELDGACTDVVAGALIIDKECEIVSMEELEEGVGIIMGVEVLISSEVEATAEVFKNRRKLSCLCLC